MKYITSSQANLKKLSRQIKLHHYSDKAQFHCGHNCFHIGKVSHAFWPNFLKQDTVFSWKIELGAESGLPNVCNFDCHFCSIPIFSEINKIENYIGNYVTPDEWEMKPVWKESIKKGYKDRGPEYLHYMFTGQEAETLFYMPCIEQHMDFFINEIEPIDNIKGYGIVSTNGIYLNNENIQRLKNARIDEVNVNVNASFFDKSGTTVKEVYKNIKETVKHIPVVSVSCPLWLPQRKELFEMLPILNDIGVKHLYLLTVEAIHPLHLKRMLKHLPKDITCCKMDPGVVVVNDNGLCEELMKEVIDKNYNYSVLDSNHFNRTPEVFDEEIFI
jgi:hypothetical protein